MEVIAVFGAAGKMGTKVTSSLMKAQGYETLCVEAGEQGIARLRERGVHPVPAEEAARCAQVIIMAIPDTLIARVAKQVVPLMQPGAMLMCLDAAAPYGGVLPRRPDVSYFVTHPCHPPIVHTEADPGAALDFTGGKAKQNVVCALMQGPDEDYGRGEAIVRVLFAPVMTVHRLTVEQMAILEPALAESVVLTAMAVMREAVDEAVRRGVPEAAARDFVLGHMKVNTGILFGLMENEMSDGAKLMIERGRRRMFRPGWRTIFEPKNVMAEVQAILRGRAKS